jgi:two-component system sensor histidine kinase/response regulator
MEMNRHTVLIVDDDEKNIKLLKVMLQKENYDLVSAGSGEEALRITAERSPDIILLDIMMPGMDGFEVCRRLKANAETKVVPVLIITALAEKQDRVKAMEAGADDFLNKPIEKTELVVRVKSLLRIKDYHGQLLENNREISEKNRSLQELEKVKDGLTHMIVHDLRNPLTAISMSIELVQLRGENLNDSQRKAMSNIVQRCDDLNNMIQSILDIQRMEEGQLKPEMAATDIVALTEEALQQLSYQMEKENKLLTFTKPESLPELHFDGNLIKRVIGNLMSNAIRHTPNEGKIDIDIRYEPDEHQIMLSIADNGDGLAPEYHEKIFEKFEQASLKLKGVRRGKSGLGLTFSKMAVEAHGGRIWVESKGDGKGSTFRFTIPVA